MVRANTQVKNAIMETQMIVNEKIGDQIEKKIDIQIEDEKLVLNLSNKGVISKEDFREICSFLTKDNDYLKFNKFEIDFGTAFFELTKLTEILIKKSYLFKNREMQVILNLGKHNLSNREICLQYLRKFKITRYRINYY